MKRMGIEREPIPKGLHQQLGIAEQFNRTLQERAGANLHQSGLPLSLWAEAHEYSKFTSGFSEGAFFLHVLLAALMSFADSLPTSARSPPALSRLEDNSIG